MKKIGKAFIGLLVLVPSLAAAEPSISISLDKNQAALNEALRLSVAVSGGSNIPSPALPGLSDFTVYSSGRSQNVSFVNGKVSSSVTFTYSLIPKRPGSFAIGPFSITVDGKTVQSGTLQVQVTAQPAPPQNVPAPGNQRGKQQAGAFVKMSLNKSRAFVSEEVILSFRFYYRISLLSNPEYGPPSLTGFLREDLPPPVNSLETINGVQYRVTEIKTALFPTQSGKITIPPATLKIRVRDHGAASGQGDIFDQFFRNARGREALLKTDSAVLNVLPLPLENKPPDFTGGVGTFNISAQTDKLSSSVGEPITLSVSIQGSGNVKSLSDPLFPPFTGFRKYDTVSSLNIEKSRKKVMGSKIYKIILVPQSSGKQTIQPVSFSYYHLGSKKYRTIRTAPITLDIEAGKQEAGAVSPLVFKSPEIQRMQEGIRYIQTEPLSPKTFSWVVDARWFMVLHVVPVLFLGFGGFYRWRTSILERDPLRRRFIRAYPSAKGRLSRVRTFLDGNAVEEAADLISEAVRNYLADRMGIVSTSVSLKSSEEFLRQSKVREQTIDEFRGLWSELERIRYAPAQFRSADIQRIFERTGDVLGQFNQQMKKSGYFSFKSSAAWIPAVLTASVLFLNAGENLSEPPEVRFEKANGYYQEGRFGEALTVFQSLRNSVGPQFNLEYNLGNTYFELGMKGKSLVHWIRAWRMEPRDSDVRHNLSFVSQIAGDPFFPEFAVWRWLKYCFYFLNLNELSLFWLAMVWIFCLYWAIFLLKGNGSFSMRQVGIFLVLICSGFWWSARLNQERLKVWAVVTSAKVEVRSGPGGEFGVGFTVPEGRRILVLNPPRARSEKFEGQWVEIGVPMEGLKGWVLTDSITKI